MQPPPPAHDPVFPVFDEISLRAGLPAPAAIPLTLPPPHKRRRWPALVGYLFTLLVVFVLCGAISTLREHSLGPNTRAHDTPRPAATATPFAQQP